MYFAKNLKFLRAKWQYSQEQFAEKLGISRGSYKDYELEAFPKPDILIKISEIFQVPVDDLLKTDLDMAEKLSIKKQGDNLRILSIVVDETDREYIQYVPEKARAGYLVGYTDPSFVGQLPSFRLPYLPAGTYRAFEISGDSMPPVNHKSIVIGRYVESLHLIKNLQTYVLVTKDEGITYKRVICKPRDQKVICLSDNPSYEPFTIRTKDILEVWSYHCHIDFSGNNTPQKKFYKELLESAEEVADLDKLLQGVAKNFP